MKLLFAYLIFWQTNVTMPNSEGDLAIIYKVFECGQMLEKGMTVPIQAVEYNKKLKELNISISELENSDNSQDNQDKQTDN